MSATVSTVDHEFKPDRVTKKDRYVVLIWEDGLKTSIPWERIEYVDEEYETGGQVATGYAGP